MPSHMNSDSVNTAVDTVLDSMVAPWTLLRWRRLCNVQVCKLHLLSEHVLSIHM